MYRNSDINYWLIKFLIAKCDIILTLSKIAKQILISEYKIPQKKIKILNFGVDTSFWKQKKFNQKQNYILSVGNDSNRDFETLIEAVGDQFELVIVTRKKVKKKKNIKVIQNTTSKNLRKLYQNAHITIIPSKKNLSENTGMSCIMQSMASGTPVLSSNLTTLKERFKDKKNIFFYKAESVQSLKRSLNKVYFDKKTLNQVSNNAKKLIYSKYNYIRLSNQISNILENI